MTSDLMSRFGCMLGAALLVTAVAWPLRADRLSPERVATPQTFAAVDPAEGEKLFKRTGCGWCHEGGGRKKARGPKLMDSEKDDSALANRIKTGKTGAMPAYGGTFSDEQIQSIVAYLRSLKPEGSS